MMVFSLLRLRLRQTVGGDGITGVAKFLAPDFLVGFFIALSVDSLGGAFVSNRVAIVSLGVALFTSVAETRKLFFSGGETEEFYFFQPTAVSRLALTSAIVSLNLAVVVSIVVPVILFSTAGQIYLGRMVLASLTAACLSISLYFLILFFVASLSRGASNIALTVLQIAMALILLAAFQLPVGEKVSFDSPGFFLVAAVALLLTSSVFVMFPFSEELVSRLSANDTTTRLDLFSITGRLKRLVFIHGGEEEAGFMFFLSNLFRNPSFRLSTIGVAATPVMVAVYWSMQGVHFLRFSPFPYFTSAELVAPLASLVVSAVLVHYFLSQNLLSSKDHEANWLFKTQGDFSVGKFVLGVRKCLILTVHIPMTIAVFVVLVFTNSLAVSAVTAVTFYSLSHVASSWFSAMQKDFPFSLPFTRIGAVEMLNLIFMFLYSFLVVIALFFSFGHIGKLLMINLLAFILIGLLDLFLPTIVNKRLKLGVQQ